MIKYQIFEVGNCIGKWYFCRQKYWWGWGTPEDDELANNLREWQDGKYSGSRRFNSKEELVIKIHKIAESKKLSQKQRESIYYKFIEEISV